MQIYRDMMAEDEKYAKMEFVDVLYDDDEATKSLTEAEAAIQKYPDLKGIISPTTVGIVAAVQAVENGERSRQENGFSPTTRMNLSAAGRDATGVPPHMYTTY